MVDSCYYPVYPDEEDEAMAEELKPLPWEACLHKSKGEKGIPYCARSGLRLSHVDLRKYCIPLVRK